MTCVDLGVWSGSFATFLAVIVALFPIFKEWRHNLKYKRILREQILIEIRDIKQSYSGKIDCYKQTAYNTENKEMAYIIPDHDKDFFHRLGDSFEKSTYISEKERKYIGILLKLFREGSYHKVNNQNAFLGVNGYNIIERIYKTSDELYKIIDKKLK